LPRGSGLKIFVVVLLLLVEAAFSALLPFLRRPVATRVLPDRNRAALITIAEVLALAGLAAVGAGLSRDYVWTRLQSHAIAGTAAIDVRAAAADIARLPPPRIVPHRAGRVFIRPLGCRNALSMAVSWGLARW